MGAEAGRLEPRNLMIIPSLYLPLMETLVHRPILRSWSLSPLKSVFSITALFPTIDHCFLFYPITRLSSIDTFVPRLAFSQITMGSTDSTNLLYLQSSPKIIFFTDFDGTITLKDSEPTSVASFLSHYCNWLSTIRTNFTFDRQWLFGTQSHRIRSRPNSPLNNTYTSRPIT
jgi:hypothetical protein